MSYQEPFPIIEGDPEEVEDPNATLAETDAGFTGPDVETDEGAIRDGVYAELRSRAPGWEAHDGNQEVWLTEAYSAVAAEIRTLCATVPEAIFVTYGQEVLGIPIRVPAPALGHVRVTAIDDQGYTLSPGQQLTIARTGDERISFQVVTGAIIDPGETVAERIEIAALEPGIAGNSLVGAVELTEPLAWIASIEVEGRTFGGDNGQDEDSYLAELSQLLRVVALRPVLPWDYAILALRIVGVGRAIAMDGYRHSDETWGHERTITLLLTDEEGEPVGSQLQTQVRNMLQELREVNVLIYVDDCDYEPVDITFEVTAFAEQNADVVRVVCEEAIERYVAPAYWRLGMTSPTIAAGEVILPPREGRPPGHMVIRVNELIGLLDRQRGVDWVDSVEINGEAVDHTLTGPTTLPRPGDVDGTVNVQS